MNLRQFTPPLWMGDVFVYHTQMDGGTLVFITFIHQPPYLVRAPCLRERRPCWRRDFGPNQSKSRYLSTLNRRRWPCQSGLIALFMRRGLLNKFNLLPVS